MNKKEISEYFSKLGKKGAKTRSKTLTPEQRSEIAKKAAAARWKDKVVDADTPARQPKETKKGAAKKGALTKAGARNTK